MNSFSVPIAVRSPIPSPSDSHAPVFAATGSAPRIPLSAHARKRMTARGISAEAVGMVLDHGRRTHVRGAVIHVVGRKEIARARSRGLDLAPFEGIHVVCASDGAIVTVYRNRDLRGLRPRRGRGWRA